MGRFVKKNLDLSEISLLLLGVIVFWTLLPTNLPGTTGITINPHALLKTGEVASGTWLLPNGRMIKPPGINLEIDSLPLGMVLSPDGRYLFVTSGGPGRQSITVIDTQSNEVIQVVEEDALYLGLAMSPDGCTLYASGGGTGKILVYDFLEGTLTPRAEWEAKGVPGGMSISEDGRHLFYVSELPKKVHIVDAETGNHLDSSFTGENPYTVIANSVKKEIYVSCEGSGKVSIYNTTFPKWLRWIGDVTVGKNPEGMAITPNGRYLFVANADDDSFTIIDLEERKVEATVDLRPYIQTAYGTAPNAIAFSQDTKRVYIAQASDNKIAVVSLPDGELIGAIPTAWYPTAVLLSPGGERIYIASGKGRGTWSSSMTDGLVNRGIVQLVDRPEDSELAALADSVGVYNGLPGDLFSVDTLNFQSPVPLRRGEPSPIKHVIFIVRENKTYDALLGDWEKGDGDSTNCVYCYEETPNLHALVERFGSGDNYYSNAEASIQGHEITTAAITNPFVEKHWSMEGRPIPIEVDVFLNPVTYPKNDFIFQNALRNDISFRDYGEAVGVGKDLMIFDPRYVHWGPFDPPFFWMFSKDVNKLLERKIEWELGIFPQLIYMLFPNDHHFGYQWPFPSPESMVADNDLATGMFVEWLSHSKYWEESVAFVIEDDPQQGADHVDNHRSIMLVASPWVKKEYVSPVHYCEANIHATIQHILGFPPMTIYDEIAQPMWDIFTNEPDYTPFSALESRVPDTYNLPGTVYARRSMGLNFLDPDEAVGLPDLVLDYRNEMRRIASQRTAAKKTGPKESLEWMEIVAALDAASPVPPGDGESESADPDLNPLQGGESNRSPLFDSETLKLGGEYRNLRDRLNAVIMPEDPCLTFTDQFLREAVGITKLKVVDRRAALTVEYRNGFTGTIRFTREDDTWKVDLSDELSDVRRLFTEYRERLDLMKEALDSGKPVERFED